MFVSLKKLLIINLLNKMFDLTLGIRVILYG